jgi:hypothetical protein
MNTLDILPDISSDPFSISPQPPKKNYSQKQISPKTKVRFHCEYCERDGHLAVFCFRRKRDEQHGSELSRGNMNRPSYGVHELSVQRRPSRFRCALPHAVKPPAVRPHDGRA